MSSTATKTSTCLCGNVQITFTGTDKGAVLCHCANCKASSGSAFMHNHRLTKSHINVDKGREHLRRYSDSNTKSGVALYRHFCTNCGSPLYLTNDKLKGFVAIQSGNMQQETRQQPTMELFADDKYGWIGQVIPKKEAKL